MVREIFNSTTDAIFIHHPETGVIEDVNQAMLDMYGYERKEVTGLSIETLSSAEEPYDQENAQQRIRRAPENRYAEESFRTSGRFGPTFTRTWRESSDGVRYAILTNATRMPARSMMPSENSSERTLPPRLWLIRLSASVTPVPPSRPWRR